MEISKYRATTTRKRRASEIENRYKACLCDLIRTDDFNDTIPIDGPSRLIEAARPCESHKLYCSSCRPGCQAPTAVETNTWTDPSSPPVQKLPARKESPPPLIETGHFPSHLHPISRNILPHQRRGLDRAEIRLQEKQSWQLHQRLIHNLLFDPYDRCICDIIGLEDYYQVVKDPDTLRDYPHRPNCLAYPDFNSWRANIQPSSTNAAYLSRIQQFRTTARTKGGVKKFTRDARHNLERLSGLQSVFHHRVYTMHCLCDFYDPSVDSPRQECLHCHNICCPCCKPSCYGLAEEDTRTKRCSEHKTCCPQCRPSCHTQDALALDEIARQVEMSKSFRDIPRAWPDLSAQSHRSSKSFRRPKVKKSGVKPVLSETQSQGLPRQTPGLSVPRPGSENNCAEHSDKKSQPNDFGAQVNTFFLRLVDMCPAQSPSNARGTHLVETEKKAKKDQSRKRVKMEQ